MTVENCSECARIVATQKALGESGGPPCCPVCGDRLFKSALRAEMEARLASLDDFCNSNTVDAAFVEATQALVRPWPTVADFLRRLADDLDAKRATTVGRDETFERLRIMGPGYDLFIGRYDPERHRM